MIYYKVKPQYSQMQCDAKFKNARLVANEIFTEKELKNLTEWQKSEYFTTHEIIPKNTYFFFGARFQTGEGWAKGPAIYAQ